MCSVYLYLSFYFWTIQFCPLYFLFLFPVFVFVSICFQFLCPMFSVLSYLEFIFFVNKFTFLPFVVPFFPLFSVFNKIKYTVFAPKVLHFYNNFSILNQFFKIFAYLCVHFYLLKFSIFSAILFFHSLSFQFLPVPELMPFRLTRQIRNLLLPLREKGTLECTMIHALRALRNNKDLLLTTMDVFIKEPSLDWKVKNKYCQSNQPC